MSESLSNLTSSATDAVAATPPLDSTSMGSSPAPTTENKPSLPTRTKREIYAQPAPIRTFPLPPFYPNNPLSLIHIAYVWLRQTVFTPPEPTVVHIGIWSPETRSVHVRDETSMRALWEQGFYGKGHLSRSEPTWQRAQEVKHGLKEEFVSEIHTAERRQQRKQMKWERARVEQEAIRQTRLKESQERAAKAFPDVPAPVGPLELLALPNSFPVPATTNGLINGHVHATGGSISNVAEGDQETAPTKLPNGRHEGLDCGKKNNAGDMANGINGAHGCNAPESGVNGVEPTPPNDSPTGDGSDQFKPMPMKRRKSVRFSPKVESTTFQLSDPPSPGVAMLNGKPTNGCIPDETVNGVKPATSLINGVPVDETKANEEASKIEAEEIVNKEHLQLTREEAFFLTFGLGVLSVVDDETKKPIPTLELFNLFRRYSFVPPPAGPADLRPDDKFLVHYAVYHHFRSLGWVPRAGIKFAVDWLLYQKGPVFDHAEYGVIVVPSYSDPWWKEQGQEATKITWAAFQNTMRGLSHVFKTIVPVYVEIPPPPVFDEALEKGIVEVFKLYKIQEVVVRRFKFSRLKIHHPNSKATMTEEDKEKMREKGAEKAARKEEKKRKKGEVKQKEQTKSATEEAAEIDA